MALAIAFAAVGGLIVGSFLNVVVHRLPRGESLTHPRSRCPSCGTQLRAIDNIPVVSWLALRGKCHHCGAPVSARYPLVELTTGALYAAVVASQDDAVRIVLGLLLVTALVPITLIDLDLRIIPNRITGPAAVAALVAVAVLDTDFLVEAIVAGIAGGGFFLIAALLYPRGLGMGDVKLAALLGLYLGWIGWDAVAIGAAGGFVIQAAVALSLLATRRIGLRGELPFGPAMLLGAVLAIGLGDGLLH